MRPLPQQSQASSLDRIAVPNDSCNFAFKRLDLLSRLSLMSTLLLLGGENALEELICLQQVSERASRCGLGGNSLSRARTLGSGLVR